MSSRNRSATAAAAAAAPAPAAAPSLRTPRRLRRRPLKASASASAPGGGRRSGPATPLLKWDVGGGEGAGASAREKQAGEVSVRRLAAGVWRLRPPEAVPGAAAGAAERRVRVGVEVRARARCASPHLVSSLVRPVLLLAWRLGMEQTVGAKLVLCELMLFFQS